ncbi:hypothetical protein C8R45DRAFT_1218632 [Mycena sanguinolenta]|nr:hypothetical protein C8R45DRAFT_1218632 [Mycena sanguinolenta]
MAAADSASTTAIPTLRRMHAAGSHGQFLAGAHLHHVHLTPCCLDAPASSFILASFFHIRLRFARSTHHRPGCKLPHAAAQAQCSSPRPFRGWSWSCPRATSLRTFAMTTRELTATWCDGTAGAGQGRGRENQCRDGQDGIDRTPAETDEDVLMEVRATVPRGTNTSCSLRRLDPCFGQVRGAGARGQFFIILVHTPPAVDLVHSSLSPTTTSATIAVFTTPHRRRLMETQTHELESPARLLPHHYRPRAIVAHPRLVVIPPSTFAAGPFLSSSSSRKLVVDLVHVHLIPDTTSPSTTAVFTPPAGPWGDADEADANADT